MRHADLLAQIPLFEGLSDEDRDSLAKRLTEKSFKEGEKVFAKGDKGLSMYIVLSGAVQIFLPPKDEDKGVPPVVLKDARTGEYFGELSLFDDKPRSASVTATVDTVLLELTRDEFGEHLSRSKTAALAILGEMAERLRETNALLSQRATKNAVQQIEENLTWGQRLADKVAALNGSWAFILFLLGLTGLWALINHPWIAAKLGMSDTDFDFLTAIAQKLNIEVPEDAAQKAHAFDPYPFILYNLVLAILVALQGPLIVMSQNRQSEKDRASAETDFRVNLKNELGIERIIAELGAFRVETTKRLEVLERGIRAERVRAEVPAKTPGGPLKTS